MDEAITALVFYAAPPSDGFGDAGIDRGKGALSPLYGAPEFPKRFSYWFHVSSGGKSRMGLP